MTDAGKVQRMRKFKCWDPEMVEEDEAKGWRSLRAASR